MAVQTLSLTDFLLARFAEDEAAAREALRGAQPNDRFVARLWGDEKPLVVTCSPERVLAECEAKRRLIALAFEHAATIDGEWGCCHDAEALKTRIVKADGPWEGDEPLPDDCSAADSATPYLLALALPYAQHPDYNPAWS